LKSLVTPASYQPCEPRAAWTSRLSPAGLELIASESVDDSYPFDVLGSDPGQVDIRRPFVTSATSSVELELA
jgi:hypothetical protein